MGAAEPVGSVGLADAELGAVVGLDGLGSELGAPVAPSDALVEAAGDPLGPPSAEPLGDSPNVGPGDEAGSGGGAEDEVSDGLGVVLGSPRLPWSASMIARICSS